MSKLSSWGNDLYTGKVSYEFVRRRKIWYVAAAVLILISLVGVFGRGINFGIEFRGGTEFRVVGVTQMENYESRATTTVSDAAPEATNISATRIGDSTIRIQTGELANNVAEDAREALSEEFVVPLDDVASNLIGPTWGATVTQNAIIALIVFTILVTIVLALYFRTWKMAVAALVAQFHDVAFTVGIYALLGIEVSPASVIGFLTILGYSIYDTIVVFDKVRENVDHAEQSKRHTFGEAANLAVNQTLIRSITTSIVALLPVGAIMLTGILFLGPGTLLDLSIALFIGIAVGAFSSVFVATPLLVHMRENEPDIKEHDRKVLKKRAERAERSAARGGGVITDRVAGDVDDADLDGDQEHLDQDGELVRTAPQRAERDEDGEEIISGRQLHPYAQRGPRNQPKRKKRR